MSDLRAPTPTAAAELATPNQADLRVDLSALNEQLYRLLQTFQSELKWTLKELQNRLHRNAPLTRIQSDIQRVDELDHRLRIPKDPIKIAAVSFLTGAAGAPFGIPGDNTYKMCADMINKEGGILGRKIDLQSKDEAGGVDAQVKLCRKLIIEDKMDVVLGYISSASCMAVLPLSDELGGLIIAYDCGTHELMEEKTSPYKVPKFKLGFRSKAHLGIDNIALALYIKKYYPNIKKVAGINQDYAWGRDSWPKGQITEDGYGVEIRIPFKSMRYQAADPQIWRFNVIRRIGATGVEDSWAPAVRTRPSFLGQSGTLEGMTQLKRGLVMDINPFVTARAVGARPETGGWAYDRALEAGANVRWGMTPSLTLNGTYNPDFSQVESDASQVLYDPRRALYFQEKRPFFLEGIEQFSTPNTLVYTRRIVEPVGPPPS